MIAAHINIKTFFFQLCQKVWLGLYDNRTHLEPDSKDENKIRDFMAQKYEKKRYYVAPTETMYEEAKKMNSPVTTVDNSKRPLGNNVTMFNSQNRHKTQVNGGRISG